MNDPTRDEMLKALARVPFADEYADFDRESAIYWFAAHYHGGQSSNLYSVLSTSPYHPGILENGPDDVAATLYQELEAEFTR